MDDIHYLIQQQENRKLEFKEKLPANLGSLFKKLNIIEQWGAGFASAIKQHLVNLKKSGLIERKGSDRAGYWQVNNFE